MKVLVAERNVERRIVALFIYIACQIAFLKLVLHSQLDDSDLRLLLPGGFFQPILYFGLGYALLLSKDALPIWATIIEAARSYCWRRVVFPQAAAYGLLVYMGTLLFPNELSAFHPIASEVKVWGIAFFVGSIVLTSVLSLYLIAPLSYWRFYIGTQGAKLLLAGIFPLSHLLISLIVLHLEDWLSIPTIKVAKFILGVAYGNVHFDLVAKTIGTSRFTVVVDHYCSGYVGIGMIIVFMVWYLHSYRQDFHFPSVLLLFPVGALAVWVLNCLRIALIVAVGTSLSSDIAIEGFHNNVGSIFFIAAALGMVWLARTSAFFCKKTAMASIVIDATNARAVPFLGMLAATLFTSAFSAGFVWLYPLNSLVGGITILLLWKYLKPEAYWPKLFPLFSGATVFLLWIAAIHPNPEVDNKFAESLFSVPIFWSSLWLVIRLFGSVVVVPFAEELTFRSYVPDYVATILMNKNSQAVLQWAPFFLSSILFGILHEAWGPGIVAGAVYYLVKKRSGRLWDSIVAHMTTNFLLSTYILCSGHWSYW